MFYCSFIVGKGLHNERRRRICKICMHLQSRISLAGSGTAHHTPKVLSRHIQTTHSNDNIYFNTPYINTSCVNMRCVTHTVHITLTHLVLCLPRSDMQDNNLHSSGRNVLSKYKLSI
ncbi:hypothetical protein NP493_544g00016 [Ridgeia piscesae]|uniref:Uncharacterized protein n=1 Tax=Ridgeia piscesae TaxID=27915 RepID=A0AAD9KVZ7_RIDPI|nr:hypothetical protein NP493_544g00016 [Ridgeia piscesae]